MTLRGLISSLCFLVAVTCFSIAITLNFHNSIYSVSSAQLRFVVILSTAVVVFGLILIL